jgi:hypothetical protein
MSWIILIIVIVLVIALALYTGVDIDWPDWPFHL